MAKATRKVPTHELRQRREQEEDQVNYEQEIENNQNTIDKLQQQINQRNSEISDLKDRFNDLNDQLNDLKNNKCEDIYWLIQSAKLVLQRNDKQINDISNNNNNTNDSSDIIGSSSSSSSSSSSWSSSSSSSSSSVELKTSFNSFNEINEFGLSKSKQLFTNQLLQEFNENINKSKVKIQIDFDESQSKLDNQKQIFQMNQMNLRSRYEKLDELFDEIINFQKETALLETETKESKTNLIKSEIEFQKAKLAFDEYHRAIEKINEINEKNSKFMDKWNQTISKGNIESLGNENGNDYDDDDNEIIYGLLEYCNLDDWFNELKTQILSTSLKIKICDIRPHHLMTLKKYEISNTSNSTSNYQKMTIGEAKYFCIVIEEIIKNKKLPKILNDIDLNEENIKFWTIKNVFNYFKDIKNMNQVAKVLFESKINGIVLLSLHELEIQNLGIENIEELNSFMNLLKQLQKNEYNKKNSTNIVDIADIDIPTKPFEDLICPLSHKIMIDPVIAQDGNTYERKAIEEWFKNGNNTSPITEEQIETFLISNKSARKQCEKWTKENAK